jgi:hypothetical protein
LLVSNTFSGDTCGMKFEYSISKVLEVRVGRGVVLVQEEYCKIDWRPLILGFSHCFTHTTAVSKPDFYAAHV